MILGARQLSFPENATGELETYYAFDPEHGTIRWSLSGDGAPFSIDAESGLLRVQHEMDYETAPLDAHGERTYQFSVIATDSHPKGSRSSERTVTVAVIDVNEPPVLSGSSVVTMNENLVFVASYTATDPERTAIGWSVVGSDASAFRLSSSGLLNSRGSLYFNQSPDYETDPTAYAVTIQAADATGLLATKGLSITILDVDETPPPSVSDTPGEDPGMVTLEPLQPREGEAVTATLEDGDGSITGATWTWEAGSVAVQSGAGSETDSYTPGSADVGKTLAVEVCYTDGEGTNQECASASSAAVLSSTAPASCVLLDLQGPASVTYPKTGTGPVASYTVRASDCNELAWSLSGTDAGSFSVSGAGTLNFTTSPTQASYAVTVAVADSSGPSLAKGVAITIDEGSTTGDQPGTIRLSPNPPRVGGTLQATLTDLDGGLHGVIWGFDDVLQPTQARDVTASSLSITPSNTQMWSAVAVQPSWLGNPVRVLVYYADALGTGKSAEAESASVQANVPAAPGSLTATPGGIYTQVDLSWPAAADNGSAITDYQYQYRKNGTSSWSGWTSVGTGTSTTVSNLDSGALYDFEVRAVNGIGAGPAVSTSSSVQAQSLAKPTSPAAKPISLAVQAAPNPFNPETTLRLGLPVGGRVVLTLYNMAGQPVRKLLDGELAVGYHKVWWDGRDEQGGPVASGVYLYRVQTQEQVVVGKIALIR
ncbi:MAG: fibronectin type III domain-containing protein [Candidatus Latescibacteria bacterium]|nr:fibronectin type III domain-containing protein [Candidatus Latescibacterota bacterium]